MHLFWPEIPALRKFEQNHFIVVLFASLAPLNNKNTQFKNNFFGLGDLKSNISAENSTLIIFTNSILSLYVIVYVGK